MLCISSRLGIDGERNNLAEASSSEDSWSNSSLHLGKHSATCMWFALKNIKIIAPWKETTATQPVMYISPSASPLLRLLLCNLLLLLSVTGFPPEKNGKSWIQLAFLDPPDPNKMRHQYATVSTNWETNAPASAELKKKAYFKTHYTAKPHI